MNRKRVLIVGFGNSLVADDGAGPRVIELLRNGGLPAGVRAEDGGSDSLCLSTLWHGEDEVWLIDAVRNGAEVGTIHRLTHELLLAVPQRHATAHLLSLPESLRWLALAYPELAAVHYRFWGIEAGRLLLDGQLSPSVAAATEALALEIRQELAGRGVPAGRGG